MKKANKIKKAAEQVAAQTAGEQKCRPPSVTCHSPPEFTAPREPRKAKTKAIEAAAGKYSSCIAARMAYRR